MKIGVLSRNANLYSTKRLVAVAKERRHEVKVIDVLRCYMNITSNKPELYYKSKGKKEILKLDVVIPRMGASVTTYGTAPLIVKVLSSRKPD